MIARLATRLVLEFASLLVILCFLAAAPAAPAPLPRPKKPPVAPVINLVGAWRMTWGQGEGDVVFTPDKPGGASGGYWCFWAGQQWVGSWRVDGKTLRVTEGVVPDRPDNVPENPLRWTVELDATGLAGKCECGGSFMGFRLVEHLRMPKEIEK